MTDHRTLLCAARVIGEHCPTDDPLELVSWARSTPLLTDDQRAAFLGASAGELRVVATVLTAEADQLMAKANAASAFLHELGRHPMRPGETIGELLARLDADDRDRLERLARLAFPEGTITVPTEGGGA